MTFELDFTSFGPLSYSTVPWDSDLFGIEFYELRAEGPAAEVVRSLPAWREELRRRGLPALAFTRIRPDDVALAKVLGEIGFYPAETTLRISLPLKRFVPLHPNAAGRAVLREASAEDLPTLVDMVEGMFEMDRFHLDPHLPRQLSDRRYAQWLERGFHDHDRLFVYETADKEPMGFYLVKGQPPGEVDLSLAGLSERYRRGGAGALMYEAVLGRCRDLGFRTATSTISTNNTDAVNLFMRLGFVVRSAQLTMHLFLS